MDTRKQMQKDTLGLTNRGISEAGFNWEDFWQHQLIRIKEIAEGEQAPKEDASGTLKSTSISSSASRRLRRASKLRRKTRAAH